jgi:hypothetical protein
LVPTTDRPLYARAFDGWALTTSILFDRAYPGLVADTLCADSLIRQVRFAAFAAMRVEEPSAIASRICAPAHGIRQFKSNPTADIVHALVSLRPRLIVEAVYGLVPDGFLGVMARLGDRTRESARGSPASEALMRTLVGLTVIGWLLQHPWTPFVVIGAIVLGAGLLALKWTQHFELQAAPPIWRRVEPHFDEPRTEEQSPSDRLLLLSHIEQLETDLKEARREANALRAEKERLERDLEKAKVAESHNRTNPLFRRVGLDENAPEWVVLAVRRAYRKHLHPDAHPAGRKIKAERRFKAAEQVFDEISKLKGFRS